MTKSPLHFETWLHYHHTVLGVHRFYIRVEDTRCLVTLLQKPPWNELVVATFASGAERDYFEQMDRQNLHIASVIPIARDAGCTHILHIDDDELVYCSAGSDALKDHLRLVPPHKPDLHMQNLEALMPSVHGDDVFRQVRAYRHFPTKYCSYTNGKSFARLDAPGLRSHGPHHFRCATGVAAANSAITHHIPPYLGCVLHFESCTYGRWRSKFMDLARRHGDVAEVFAKVPFRFYRESFDACLRILREESRRPLDTAVLQSAEHAALDLWCEWKLEPPGLPLVDLSAGPVVLPCGVTILDAFEFEKGGKFCK